MYGVLMPPEQPEEGPVSKMTDLPPDNSMAPPPPGEFASREDLLEFQKDWAERQGFAVVIGRSRPNRLWIKCDRGGSYSDKHLHDPENRKRKRKATRLTGCPFNVKATMRKDKIWRCHTESPEHNHPPSDDLTVHPSLRRMTDNQLTKVNEMTEAGNTPVETLNELQRLWPGIKVLRRDIYNARKKYKTEKELAEIAQGLHAPQPFEDPNGRMPGPTQTGRWEWLEDGDEVKRKKRIRSSVTGSGQNPLAPELREVDSPQVPQVAARRQAPGLGTMPARPFQPARPPSTQTPSPAPMATDFGAPANVSPKSANRFRHYTPTQSQAQRSGFSIPVPQGLAGPTDSVTNGTAGRNRLSGEIAPMAQMVSPVANGATSSITMPKVPSGQVLMSRIERMEQEQSEQRSLLSQILNAVQAGPLRQ